MQNETYKSFTELMKTARGNKAIGQCLCDIVDFQEILDDTPNADVVPVVRCENCIYANDYGTICRYGVGREVEPEHYCSYGERKEE